MWRWLVIGITMLILSGCGAQASQEGVKLTEPPIVQVKANDAVYEATRGAYCWSYNNTGECVDIAGYVELQEKPLFTVEPGTQIEFIFPESPIPDVEELVYSLTTAYEDVDFPIENHSFTAPDEPGIYYFGYNVNWEGNPGGSVSYALMVAVKKDS
ncbi:hypothetical protein [Sutcliffiella rhizosphaerae]|uniref:Lipoprotein n=1 Tax=Sutcliffiella rhizosphaerae TaxID=2880967 RepID=A0ABN8A6P2_9BACI|nr:hypothetical protein [Sutcliffiella rhizosphaerae]CAG9619416.1 hypothetical protein BACCIP111883_00183 [Sutcliffiella rhizosphaerae]